MIIESPQIVVAINRARQYPSHYMSLIDKQLKQFVNEFDLGIGKNAIWPTKEGISAWIEARNFLMNAKPQKPIQNHIGLSYSARDHCIDQAQRANVQRIGLDGSSFIDRVLRYCHRAKSTLIELISCSFCSPSTESIEQAILTLIIDDGVVDRSHRLALFGEIYNYAGAHLIKTQHRITSVIALSENRLALRKGKLQINELEASPKQQIQFFETAKFKVVKEKQEIAQEPWSFKNLQDVLSPVKQRKVSNNFAIQPSVAFHFEEVTSQSGSLPYESDPELKNKKKNERNVFQTETSKASTAQQPIRKRSISRNNMRSSQKTPKKNKKVIAKDEKIREYMDGDFLVQQTKTRLTYADGTNETLIEKRSQLQNTLNPHKF